MKNKRATNERRFASSTSSSTSTYRLRTVRGYTRHEYTRSAAHVVTIYTHMVYEVNKLFPSRFSYFLFSNPMRKVSYSYYTKMENVLVPILVLRIIHANADIQTKRNIAQPERFRISFLADGSYRRNDQTGKLRRFSNSTFASFLHRNSLTHKTIFVR